MKVQANNVEEYLEQVPPERRVYFDALRDVVRGNLPNGFVEQISYGMIGYVVPHSRYPNGYHCDPGLPLPFASIASQKNFIGLYHMGIYANTHLSDWFVTEYPKHCKLKLDMGKSCIRFKKVEQIPYDLVGELMQKMSVDDWIKLYEENIKT
jgi:hypothetical protein